MLLARIRLPEHKLRASDGMSVFLLDLREIADGLIVRPLRDLMFNHETNEVFFDEVRIPSSSLIGEQGLGFRYILDGMNAERILIAAECIGDARWFIDKATRYACESVRCLGGLSGRTKAFSSQSRARSCAR